jgi:hypothetical protein
MPRDQRNLPNEQPDNFLGDLARRVLECDARWVIVGIVASAITCVLLVIS